MQLTKAKEANPEVVRPLALSLREQATKNRQVEVAALAISSLCTINEFEPAIEALRDDRFRSYWRSIYESLLWSLTNDNEAVAALLKALAKSRTEDAALLYRLLWGYTNEQLAAGEDKKLVELLEHRAVDVRVLALENLRRITQRTGTFRPERDPGLQRRALQEWQSMQAKGQIRWPG